MRSKEPSYLDINCAAAFEAARNNNQVPDQIGFKIRTNSTFRARTKLYKWRAENSGGEYTNIQLKLSPDDPEHEIWLINLPKSTIEAKCRNTKALVANILLDNNP